MLLGLTATAIVAAVLLWDLGRPRVHALTPPARAAARRALRVLVPRSESPAQGLYDPGRERRAEQRARELLRSCVNGEEWAMYRDLGFVRVWGGVGEGEGARYAYLVYPHRPIVAYVPATGALLSEYCVAFPDHTRPYGSTRLPDADDVLAKWMALAADERKLIADANMHLPGRQLDPEQVRDDLARLARWERERPATHVLGTQRLGDTQPPGEVPRARVHARTHAAGPSKQHPKRARPGTDSVRAL